MKKALIGLLVLAAGTASAQEQRPAGWNVRYDRPNTPDSALTFVTMEPGWHVTTSRAAGILYNPATRASGQYRVEAEIFLFDPGGRREAFGILIGGKNLDAENQSYTYFLIREGGECIIKRRSGSQAPTIRDWTAHPAIVSFATKPEGESTAKNILAIDVGAEQVRFLVNGQEVASLPKSEVETDGIVGIRVNHRLNLHVSRLEVKPASGS